MNASNRDFHENGVFRINDCAKNVGKLLLQLGEVERLLQFQEVLRDCPRELMNFKHETMVSPERRKAATKVYRAIFPDEGRSSSEVITIDSDDSDSDSYSSVMTSYGPSSMPSDPDGREELPVATEPEPSDVVQNVGSDIDPLERLVADLDRVDELLQSAGKGKAANEVENCEEKDKLSATADLTDAEADAVGDFEEEQVVDQPCREIDPLELLVAGFDRVDAALQELGKRKDRSADEVEDCEEKDKLATTNDLTEAAEVHVADDIEEDQTTHGSLSETNTNSECVETGNCAHTTFEENHRRTKEEREKVESEMDPLERLVADFDRVDAALQELGKRKDRSSNEVEDCEDEDQLSTTTDLTDIAEVDVADDFEEEQVVDEPCRETDSLERLVADFDRVDAALQELGKDRSADEVEDCDDVDTFSITTDLTDAAEVHDFEEEQATDPVNVDAEEHDREEPLKDGANIRELAAADNYKEPEIEDEDDDDVKKPRNGGSMDRGGLTWEPLPRNRKSTCGKKKEHGGAEVVEVDVEEEEEDEEDEDEETLRERRLQAKELRKMMREHIELMRGPGNVDEYEEVTDDDEEMAEKEEKPENNEDLARKPRKRVYISESDDSDLECGVRKNSPKRSSNPDSRSSNVHWDHIRSRKIMTEDKLAKSTVEAEKNEAERRRRLEEKQKEYNGEALLNGPTHTSLETFVLDADLCGDPPEPVVVNEEFVKWLKPHQLDGIRFFYDSTIESMELLNKPGGGGILAHCMGLGKTFQVIAYLHAVLLHRKIAKVIHRVLIIVPANVVVTWESEFEKWLNLCDNRNIDVYRFHPTSSSMRNRLKVLQEWQASANPSVFVVGYEMFRNLVVPSKAPKDEKLRVECTKIILNPDLVVCDEAHVLKNSKTQIYYAVMELKTTRRLCLTGTPMQNHLLEYYCMVDFVKKNILGSVEEFSNRYKNPIEGGSQKDSTQGEVALMKRQSYLLHDVTKGCINRRDHTILFESLPPKLEYVLKIALSAKQKEIYKLFVTHMKGCGVDLGKGGLNMTANYTRTLLITAHPYQILLTPNKFASLKEGSQKSCDKNEERLTNSAFTSFVDKLKDILTKDDENNYELSTKLTVLLQLIKKCEEIGDKLLVFSQSIETLNLIERMLKYYGKMKKWFTDDHQAINAGDESWGWNDERDYVCITGSTPMVARKRYQDRFNEVTNKRLRLMLISTKAGCLGTNYVGANRVVIFDACWNPATDAQALFRVCRYGQTKPTYIYRLVAMRAVESVVYKRQVKKVSTSKRVIDETAIRNHFNASELLLEQDEEPEEPAFHSEGMPKDRLLVDLLESPQSPIKAWLEHESLFNHVVDEELTEQEKETYLDDYKSELEMKWTLEQSQQRSKQSQLFNRTI